MPFLFAKVCHVNSDVALVILARGCAKASPKMSKTSEVRKVTIARLKSLSVDAKAVY
jgi:hypothetical protein